MTTQDIIIEYLKGRDIPCYVSETFAFWYSSDGDIKFKYWTDGNSILCYHAGWDGRYTELHKFLVNLDDPEWFVKFDRLLLTCMSSTLLKNT